MYFFVYDILKRSKKGCTFFPTMNSRTISPSKVRGRAAVPASKSQTIRALLIAALADGTSIITNPLVSGDTLSCMKACSQLGASITRKEGTWTVRGVAPEPDSTGKPPMVIDVGNSGTTLYLGLGAAAYLQRPVIFTGDEQIRRRPLESLTASLSDLGVYCELPVSRSLTEELGIAGALQEGSAPCLIRGPIAGGSTVISCPTSQYLSGLLLSCPLGLGESVIEVPLLHERPYVEMTLAWLDEQGISYTRDGWSRFVIPGGQRYAGFEKMIAGDFSSASFFFCAAAVTGSTLTVSGLDRNDPQGDKDILGCLEQMGCSVSWIDENSLVIQGPEPGTLKPVELDLNAIPDTLPVLAVTACFAQGTTMLYNVPQARIKETDRIAVMCRELTKLGVRIEELDEGLLIHGGNGIAGGCVQGHGDHRVIMALAVGALAGKEEITIDDTSAVEITFPSFFTILEQITAGET